MGETQGIGLWLKRQYREIPATYWLVLINCALWFLNFFNVPQPGALLTGEVGVSTAWRWLTYPFFTPGSIIGLIFLAYLMFWVGGSLERGWGTEKFVRVFVAVTLLTGCTTWLGAAYSFQSSNPPFTLAGLWLPEATLFVIWCSLNPEYEILAYFVLRVKAKYLAFVAIFVTYFGTGPVTGLFAIALPIAGWFWAKRDSARRHGGSRPGKSVGQRLQERKREKKKSRFKVLEGKKLDTTPDSQLPKAKVPDLRELNRAKAAKEKTANEAELDRILDKIRFEGMTALTPEEKASLDKQSQRLNDEG